LTTTRWTRYRRSARRARSRQNECDNCAVYESQIQRLQQEGQLGDLVVGKMVLTQPGCRGFKRANPWLGKLDTEAFQVGVPCAVESEPKGSPYSVVSEDDGTTGYFYALDARRQGAPILDALQEAS
jgi:hypothetical protein